MNEEVNPMDKLIEFFNNRADPDERIPEELSSELLGWLEETKPSYLDPMVPPWRFYPHIPFGSLGWRMGPGEDYWIDFVDWMKTLSGDEQLEYFLDNPEPDGWEGYYSHLKATALKPFG